jgi:rhamnosyltransferase
MTALSHAADPAGSRESIAAIIPVYQPDLDKLRRVWAAVAPQVGRVLVVDNGCTFDASLASAFGSLETIRMPHNMGVAAALNAGVLGASASGASAFLFLDQDSVPAPDMVQRLVDGWSKLASKGEKVAACGPSHREPGSPVRNGFVQARGFGFRQVLPPEDEPVVACEFLITSGQLVPRQAIEEVGLMDEPLFIDHVDTEWCFRARHKGYRCFGMREAVMEHELGTRRKRIWFGRWRQVPVHAPFRYYFIARNSVALRGRPYMPAIWRRHDLLRLSGLYLHNGFLSAGGRAVRAAFRRGLSDGLRGHWLDARACASLIDQLSGADFALG